MGAESGVRPLDRLDATAARQWATVTRAALAGRRAEIDALNVFPVPDGDTGTNLYLTFDGALEATVLRLRPGRGVTTPASLEQGARTFASAMILTARGNSGVILAQYVAGLVDGALAAMREGGTQSLDAPGLAAATEHADRYAWTAVAEPVEGTMLSVSRAVAERAAQCATAGADLATLTRQVSEAARTAVLATREQLPVLAAAGVVDAGAVGLLLVVESLRRVVTTDGVADWLLGREALRPVPGLVGDDLAHASGPGCGADWAEKGLAYGGLAYEGTTAGGPAYESPAYDGPAYEVMCQVREPRQDIAALREALAAHGQSVAVGGDAGVATVHVHTDAPQEALAIASRFGTVRAVRVTDLRTGSPGRVGDRDRDPDRDRGRDSDRGRDRDGGKDRSAVVACVMGEGLIETFRAAGAVVVRSAPGARASTGAILTAARSSAAESIILLPNDKDTRLVADAAAELLEASGVSARVVPTLAVVQGLAALAVHDPGAALADAVASMTAAADHTRYATVSIATRAARTAAGWCAEGDVLGFVDGDIAVIGQEAATVAGQVLALLLADGGELLTVVGGADASPRLVEAVVSAARLRRRGLEITTIDGAQPIHLLLLGLE